MILVCSSEIADSFQEFCVFILNFPERSGHLVRGETYARVCSHLEITERMLDFLGREILVVKVASRGAGEKKGKKILMLNC